MFVYMVPGLWRYQEKLSWAALGQEKIIDELPTDWPPDSINLVTIPIKVPPDRTR